VNIVDDPHPDGLADPGEVVCTWVVAVVAPYLP
jgi:hypothetical protein